MYLNTSNHQTKQNQTNDLYNRQNLSSSYKKKQITDVIEQYSRNCKSEREQNDDVNENQQIDSRKQKNYLNQLYNNDIAPEDSEKTLFYYLKTLAYEMVIVLFTFLSIFIALMTFYDALPTLSRTQGKRALMFLSFLTIIAVIMQTQTRIKWLKQKKQKQSSASDEYFGLFIEILFLLPCPNVFMNDSITINSQLGQPLEYTWDQLLTLSLLVRAIYFYRFIIHTELYYGSRPDRLSRLYTVKFGTFNAFKFLINEKPLLIVILMFTVNVVLFPLILLLLEGKINQNLSSFMDCVHFCVVTQVTVGYGNINVITIFGRVVSIFCVLIGVTSTSLLLIFFMRLMQQSSQQEQAHILLSSLEKRQLIAKARVLRIQNEYLHSKIRCAPEQVVKYEQKVRRFRFQNRRNITFQRQQPANVKRMMLSNFSAVIELINELKQKQSILSKLVQFTMKTQKNPDTQMIGKSIQSQSSEESDFWEQQKQDADKLFPSRNGIKKSTYKQSIKKGEHRNQLKKTILKSNFN